jgi:hypothetical protein
MPLGSTRRTVPGKANKAEVAARVEAVFELRIGGAGFTDIREYARAPTDRQGQKLPPWDVSDSQLWRYIAAADKLCKERYNAKADHLLARHLLRRERLYAHTLEVGDFKTALAILKDEAVLEGHYLRANAEQSRDGIDVSSMGTADVVKLLAERLRQVDAAELSTVEKSRLTAALADSLLRAIGVDVIDKRLEALQAVLMGRKDKEK